MNHQPNHQACRDELAARLAQEREKTLREVKQRLQELYDDDPGGECYPEQTVEEIIGHIDAWIEE